MQLGEEIKNARKNKNLSQEELAQSLGVSRQAISKWENGTAIPHGINRELLIDILGLDIESEEPKLEAECIELKKSLEKRRNIIVVLLCAIFLMLFILIIFGVRKKTVDTNIVESRSETNTEDSNKIIENSITSILFFDKDGKVISEDALWYNLYFIDYITVSWNGETPQSVEIYTVPAGSETINEKKLEISKGITQETDCTMIPLNQLKETSFSQHLIVTLSYGEQSISSDIYNMLYDENYPSVDNEEMDTLDTMFDTVILSISNVGFSYQQVEWIHIDKNQILGDDIELIDNRYYITSKNTEIKEIKFDENCTFSIVDHSSDDGEVISVTKEEFISQINQSLTESNQYVYLLHINGDKVFSIIER